MIRSDEYIDGFAAGHAIRLGEKPDNPYPLRAPERKEWADGFANGRTLGRVHRTIATMMARQPKGFDVSLAYRIYGKENDRRAGIVIPPASDMTGDDLSKLIWELSVIRMAMD